ncbi:MAG: tetratricopeptide repeat protein [Candidatus Anammoxibacter sp.]
MRNSYARLKLSHLSLKLTVLIILTFSFQLSALSLLYASDADQAVVHYNRGYDYYKKGEYDKGIEELEKSLKLDPDNENAHYGLGNCYYRKQIYEKAVTQYAKSIEINPDFANAHYGLGTAYSALRKTDEADEEFTIYRKLKSGQGQVKGAVAATDKAKTKTEKKSTYGTEKRSRKSSIKSRQSRNQQGRNQQGRNRLGNLAQEEKKAIFEELSPKNRIKKILAICKIKSPGAYKKIFAEMWDNSYVGKVFIGIIGFVGITQVWLVLITFQGVLLWRMKGKR